MPILALVLAIQSIRELVFAVFQASGDSRERGFVNAIFYGFVSYAVWWTLKSRNSN